MQFTQKRRTVLKHAWKELNYLSELIKAKMIMITIFMENMNLLFSKGEIAFQQIIRNLVKVSSYKVSCSAQRMEQKLIYLE